MKKLNNKGLGEFAFFLVLLTGSIAIFGPLHAKGLLGTPVEDGIKSGIDRSEIQASRYDKP